MRLPPKRDLVTRKLEGKAGGGEIFNSEEQVFQDDRALGSEEIGFTWGAGRVIWPRDTRRAANRTRRMLRLGFVRDPARRHQNRLAVGGNPRVSHLDFCSQKIHPPFPHQIVLVINSAKTGLIPRIAAPNPSFVRDITCQPVRRDNAGFENKATQGMFLHQLGELFLAQLFQREEQLAGHLISTWMMGQE